MVSIYLMKLISLLTFFTFSSLAATPQSYDLDIKYSLEEGPTSIRRMIVKEKSKAEVIGPEHFLEVVAEEGEIMDRKGILLSFNVGYIKEDGTRTILSQPKMLLKENSPAEFTIDDVTLAVTAKRK